MKTAFVTGGAGFIGSHLVELLLEKGWKVKILVRKGKMHKRYNDIIYKNTIKRFDVDKNVEIVYGDLKNINSYSDAIKDIDVMFHVAGIAYPYFGLPKEEYFEVNTDATKELVKFCERLGVKRFVYVSSIEAAGPSKDREALTEESCTEPTDAYGESKRNSEEFLEAFKKKNKMEVAIVRPPMTYGERSPLLARLFRFVKSGRFPMFGKGDALFEFCYVKNLVYGMYLVGTKDEAAGETYFISEESYKIIDVVNEIADVMGVEVKVIYIPKWIAYLGGFCMEVLNHILPFYPFRGRETGSPIFSRKSVDWITNDRYVCSIEKIKKELGYQPLYTRKEGIKRTIDWYEKKRLL
jgi:dihydroflavonol-4-reductase